MKVFWADRNGGGVGFQAEEHIISNFSNPGQDTDLSCKAKRETSVKI